MADALLIIFIKNPEFGKVKTRLAASIGELKALAVYNTLLQHTHRVTKSLRVDKIVHYSDFVDKNDVWENHEYQKVLQQGNDLGQKMEYAFHLGFSQGYRKIVIIGSDCIELTSDHLNSAFSALEENQVVIGPAEDGGYYLLGMKALYNSIFINKTWSTSSVLEETLKDIHNLKLSCRILEKLNDVDEEKDLGDLLDLINPE